MSKWAGIIIAILGFVFTVAGIVGTVDKTVNEIITNSINQKFTYKESDNGKVELLLPNQETVVLLFGNDSVRVVNSSLVEGEENRRYTAIFICSYAGKNGIMITRSNSEIIGEYGVHTVLYKIGYKKEQTRDADIEYKKDRRWYVNVASEIFGWLGII